MLVTSFHIPYSFSSPELNVHGIFINRIIALLMYNIKYLTNRIDINIGDIFLHTTLHFTSISNKNRM